MDAKQEVKSYIETKEIPGALLLTVNVNEYLSQVGTNI